MTNGDELIDPTKPQNPQQTRYPTTKGRTMIGVDDKADNNGVSKTYPRFWICIIGFAFALKQTQFKIN